MKMMEKRSEKPPYFCHYMSWRLGTWEDESQFQRLEEMLCRAESIPNWAHEKKSFVNSAEFADFWSLVWQLQVAEHLCHVGTNVQWVKTGQKNPGPDLSVDMEGSTWFVECYVFRKSFGLLKFLEELLRKIDADVEVDYDLCLKFSLPSDSERYEFLDGILSPFLDPDYLPTKKKQAEKESPVILYENPHSSLVIYIEADDIDAHNPSIMQKQTGEPKLYVDQVLKEVITAKKLSNDLEHHHPNILAVNFMLSTDFTLAESYQLPPPTIPSLAPIDVLAVFTTGIDEHLAKENVTAVYRSKEMDCMPLDRICNTSDYKHQYER